MPSTEHEQTERVISRAHTLAGALNETVHVYSNGHEVWLATRSTWSLFRDRQPVAIVRPLDVSQTEEL